MYTCRLGQASSNRTFVNPNTCTCRQCIIQCMVKQYIVSVLFYIQFSVTGFTSSRNTTSMVSGTQIKSISMSVGKVTTLVETTSPQQGIINQANLWLDKRSGVAFSTCTHRDYISLLYHMVHQFIMFYSSTAIVGYQETHIRNTPAYNAWH